MCSSEEKSFMLAIWMLMWAARISSDFCVVLVIHVADPTEHVPSTVDVGSTQEDMFVSLHDFGSNSVQLHWFVLDYFQL